MSIRLSLAGRLASDRRIHPKLVPLKSASPSRPVVRDPWQHWPSIAGGRNRCDGGSIMRRLLTRWPPRFLRTPEAARYLGLSARTLEKHRSYGTGPKYRKVGGRVIYALTDLREWADLGMKKSTSDPGSGTVLPAKPILAAGCTRPHPAPRNRREGGSAASNSAGANSAEPDAISGDPRIGNADHNGECGNRAPSHDGVAVDSSAGLERVGQRADRALSAADDSKDHDQ